MSDLTRWADYLEQRPAPTVPRRVEVYPTTTSTQDIVKARATEPLLVLADQQTAGRGRLGRRWHAPPGAAVLMSFTHRLDTGRSSPDHIAFRAALGAAVALEKLLHGTRIGIKWPNDLVVDGKKLAGILVETVGPVAVIGVGINTGLTPQARATLPSGLQGRTTSLAILGAHVDQPRVAAQVVEQIDRYLRSRHTQPLIEQWRDRSVLSHQRLTLRHNGQEVTGTVMDLDPDLGLIVRRDSGEIVHLPAATTTVL